MDERILEIAGKQLLILLAVRKGIDTINKDNYRILSRSIQSLLPTKEENSPHRILNVVNSKFKEIREIFKVNDEFQLAIFKARIECLDIQATIDKVTNYFVTNMYK